MVVCLSLVKVKVGLSLCDNVILESAVVTLVSISRELSQPPNELVHQQS